MITGHWSMITDQFPMEEGDVAGRETIDIQERTFEFGVRIVKFVDRLPRTLAATELGRQLMPKSCPCIANAMRSSVSCIPFSRKPAPAATHLTIDHCSLNIDH
jgi:hypothetical protein